MRLDFAVATCLLILATASCGDGAQGGSGGAGATSPTTTTSPASSSSGGACKVAADCPPASGCDTAVCNQGVCGTANGLPADGECVTYACDKGMVVPTFAPAAKPCSTGTCDAMGACAATCTTDVDCKPPDTCDAGISRCSQGPKCTDYCVALSQHCMGKDLMYESAEACYNLCAALPPGTLADMSGDTVGCRLYHAGAPAMADPDLHCIHAGPGGAGVCGMDCEAYCYEIQSICTGANQQYADLAACHAACALFATTPPYSANGVTGNDVGCRLYHLQAAAFAPASRDVHCPHAGAVSIQCQ